ncbi:MAG: copper resistance protein NlpE, partial [Bacteroidales bacterium]|nr:copper resistance protein NlpE [Bacteroidales bacterium]
MKSKLLILFVSVLSFTACGTGKKTTNRVTKIQSDAFSQTYFGIIPCADCEGIEYTINFNDDFTYNRKSAYLGRTVEVFESSGNYRIQDGIIQLLNDDDGIHYFKKSGENLQALDRNRNEVTGSLAGMYILKPVKEQTETAEGNVHKLKIKRAGEGVDFFAIGNEPFWSLDMDFEEKFYFEALAGISLSTPPIASK